MSSTIVRRQNTIAPEQQTRNGQSSGTMTSLGSRNTIAGKPAVAAFGSRWGDNIWSTTNSFGNGFGSASLSRDSRTLQDVTPTPLDQADGAAKTGSGLLVDSSISDNWGSSTLSTNRDNSQARAGSQSRLSETLPLQQPKGSRSGSYQNSDPTVRNSTAFGGRPSAINLGTTNGHSSRPTFGSNFISPVTSRCSEQAPTVYTKFDRPSPTAQYRHGELDALSWAQASSMDDRRSNAGSAYNSHPSMPASRNSSMPPSRHSDDHPSDLASFGQQTAISYAENGSTFSTQPNGAFSSQLGSRSAQLPLQFGQMSLNGDLRTGSSRGLNASASGFSTMGHSQNLASLRQPRQDHGRSQYQLSLHQENGTNGDCFLSTSLQGPQHQFNGHAGYANLSNGSEPMYNGRTQLTRSESLTASNCDSRRDSGHDRDVSTREGFTAYHSEHSAAMLQRVRALQMQEAQLTDPRIAQFIAEQWRASYSPFYGYGAASGPHFSPIHPYMQMPSMGMMPIVDAPRGPRVELESGNGLRSALLEEFKNNNKTNKRYELKDIYDHVCEFTGDQHGSRFIQQKLETANSDEKERIFLELQPNAIPLMTDVFGNYVIQKFFEHGDQNQKKLLANQLKGQVLTLSLQMYGCRVVQKALEHVLVDQQASLVQELEHNVLKCVKDQNGNHVVQKAIERCPPSNIRFILNAFVNQVQHLSVHSYGCRVIQRCLEHCEPSDKRNIMAELHDGMAGLVGDQYGNYVVQHVVEHGTETDRLQVLNIISGNLEQYSKHKFASNVVEKCLYFANDAWRRDVIHTLIAGNKRESESALLSLIRDQYGNYVIQKLLDVVSRHDYALLVENLQPEMNKAKRSGCGKQVVSIEKRMHRFAPSSNHGMQYALPYSGRNGNGGSSSSFAVDAKPFQSAASPSINGDAVAGAANSRKGSEPSSEQSFRG